ncbi:MAG: hypothetical protein R3C19_07495 [Planctomycetaceae bacterium]
MDFNPTPFDFPAGLAIWALVNIVALAVVLYVCLIVAFSRTDNQLRSLVLIGMATGAALLAGPLHFLWEPIARQAPALINQDKSLTAIVIAGVVCLGVLAATCTGRGRRGVRLLGRGIKSLVDDVRSVSPRRVFAMAGLTVREALRRKALLVFVVFAMLLMFAGWFLTGGVGKEDMQVNVHITFVLTTISWLILPVVMFLSCWGIPEDIRLRSLHTVVTKPTRRVEVVLGRMLGFGSVSVLVLVVMAVAGLIWVKRQVPADVQKERLICRVPVYGLFYFLDRSGTPTRRGINVGDPWEYRSHIEGNTKARAVWVFSDVTPDRLGDELRLESRFESFRTIKGSDESIQQGLEAQYTLVNNPREETFGFFGAGASFREVGDQLREGQFQNASASFADMASRMRSTPSDFPVADTDLVWPGFLEASNQLKRLGGDFTDVQQAFEEMATALSNVNNPEDTAEYEVAADKADRLSEVLAEKGDDLLAAMPRLEVPLEPFRVLEYHEGDNQVTYPRKLTFAPDYETLARYLATTISAWNDEGRLVDGDQLKDSLIDDLAAGTQISELNAELLVEVLSEQISEGALAIDNGKLTVTSGDRWLQYFDQIVRQEKLISQDPEGWKLEVDIFDDLVNNDGRLRIEVACLNDQMFIGMARPDMFLRLPNKSFAVGYAKAVLNIGLMLLLVVALAVTASCVVKGPVAFFLTLALFTIGQFFHDFMYQVMSGQAPSSGLIESALMIARHRNPSIGLDSSEQARQVIGAFDSVFRGLLMGVSQIVPDFGVFSEASAYVENGFDVPWNSSVLPALAVLVGFLIPCVLAATAFLKFRELEAK